MRDQVELSAAIKRAMEQKRLSPEEMGKKLGVSTVMLQKIICGDVVPSRHLEKQMIEVLEIKPERVKKIVGRRRKVATAEQKRQARPKAA